MAKAKTRKTTDTEKRIQAIAPEHRKQVNSLCTRLGESFRKLYEADEVDRAARYQMVRQIFERWAQATTKAIVEIMVANLPDLRKVKGFVGYTEGALGRYILLAAGPVQVVGTDEATGKDIRARVPLIEKDAEGNQKTFTIDGKTYEVNPDGVTKALKNTFDRKVVSALRKVNAIPKAEGRAKRTDTGETTGPGGMAGEGNTPHQEMLHRLMNTLHNFAAGTYGFDSAWHKVVQTIRNDANAFGAKLDELAKAKAA